METAATIKGSNENLSSKFKSRKFLVSTIQATVVMILPVIYRFIGISDDILKTVLVSSTAIIAGYTGFNVLDQHLNGASDGDNK